MADITLKGNMIHTMGELPQVGTKAPNFKLISTDLSEVTLEKFGGKKKILSIFPSVDTETCAMSVRTFNKNASELENTVVINISKDLPFAQKRFCAAEGIKNVEVLSDFRSTFSKDYNLEIIDGPLKGLCSRAIIILDEEDKVLYTEQVSETTQEPNYEKALSKLK